MKKIDKLELENSRLKRENESLRKENERLRFGKHIIRGFITSLRDNSEYSREDIHGDFYGGSFKTYRGSSQFEITLATNEFPIELWHQLNYAYSRNNARLKFTVELDNE